MSTSPSKKPSEGATESHLSMCSTTKPSSPIT
eukprot:CAMPEP_0184657428 /NCGR_PEP_ID=MMETSP0308-20130426/19505_1 /TAXON_ID=38269 /ORGANISM="Gloeochaete witrockiana, Strain SAG 46.84" /LENGTH=31 /DNA_ID= /DNA_START= /DNA_END= /DNA_ORIENTATION=